MKLVKILRVFMFIVLLGTITSSCLAMTAACSDNPEVDNDGGGNNSGIIRSDHLAEQNILRSMQLVDSAVSYHFKGEGMAMSRYYNPYTNSNVNKDGTDEKGSVWMYTSSIEAVNAILHGLKAHKENGRAELYDKHFNRYTALLAKLYDNIAYYKGTFRLTSYTQTKDWSVYGVDRGNAKGTAQVDGIYNVYDDQQWLMRELIEAYRLTGTYTYLTEAEYLAEYVLDGWDCVLDTNGKEYGGIPWGPGYVTKHSCSNGPVVSPLVWLHELYKGKNDEISYKYIATDGSRKTATLKKSDYYLKFAKAVYAWQKTNLLREDGVYHDMMGGCDPDCNVAYETVNGMTYRKHTNLRDRVGAAYSYNCGSMLSGAADLYRATGENTYVEDAKKLSDASFKYFAKQGVNKPGYYTYDIIGFNNWFNGVLMRAYVDVYPSYNNASAYVDSFQKNLDYGYENFFYKGFLPPDLLAGWTRENGNNRVEGMFTFAFAAEYATLARYELEKNN
jgi:predicted alpha-1,6-mannanase (GH76 family)